MLLRPVVWEDFAFIKRMVTDEKIYRYIKNGVKWADQKVIDFIENCIEKSGSYFYVGTISEKNKTFDIGLIGVQKRKKKFSMTVFISPRYQGRGYFWKFFNLFKEIFKKKRPDLYHFYVQVHQENLKMNKIMNKKYKVTDTYYIGKILVDEYKVLLRV